MRIPNIMAFCATCLSWPRGAQPRSSAAAASAAVQASKTAGELEALMER